MYGRIAKTANNALCANLNVLTQVAGRKKTESVSARYVVIRQSTSMRRNRTTSASVRTVVKKKSMIGKAESATDANTNVPIQREARKREADVSARHVACGCLTSMRKHRMINANVSTAAKKKNITGQAEAWVLVFHSICSVRIAVFSVHTDGKQVGHKTPA
ncbi:MAG: hypothetical protein SO401_08930 [Blautia sp.]|nr:hypothetical protein [Blautia sp.]